MMRTPVHNADIMNTAEPDDPSNYEPHPKGLACSCCGAAAKIGSSLTHLAKCDLAPRQTVTPGPITPGKRPTLMFSIHGKHIAKMVEGTKTIELRRGVPRDLEPGDSLLMYETSAGGGRRRVVAKATCKRVEVATPAEIWRDHHERVGVTEAAFDDYYRGADVAVAIHIYRAEELPRPLALPTGTRAPQSWCEWKGERLERLERKRDQRRVDRHARAATGKCLHCPEPAEPGKRYCSTCNQKALDRRADQEAAGLCTRGACSEPAVGGRYCEQHRAIEAERGRKRRAAAEAKRKR